MYAQVEKKKEDKSRVAANSIVQQKNNVKQGFGFVDKRGEAIVQQCKLLQPIELRKETSNPSLTQLYSTPSQFAVADHTDPKIGSENYGRDGYKISLSESVVQLVNKKREEVKLARKKARRKLQMDNTLVYTTRVASGGGVIEKSAGNKVQRHEPLTVKRWNSMIENHNVVKKTSWPLWNCAESQLWMTLMDKGIKPKNVDVVVKKFTRVGKSTKDTPCENCKQWVYKEFKSLQ